MSISKVQTCTICAAQESSLVLEKENDGRGPGKISVHRCNACNNIYLGQYKKEYISDLYIYYKKYQNKSKDALFNPLTARSYLKVLALLSQHQSGRRVLDVGCGMGSFVDAGIKAGWEVSGIELALPAVEIAQGFGLPVRQLDFFSEEIKLASYDVITFFEVIEHLSDPVNFLKRAFDVVKPGGHIYLTTPNFNSLDRRIQGADWHAIHREHLTYFTLDNLRMIVEKNTKFEIIRNETRNASIESFKYLIKYYLHNKHKNSNNINKNNLTDAKFREVFSDSRALRWLKSAANGVLNAASSGSTIVLLLKRPV
jgi:2-polyprenyl-3-methyl-5-hydroxy-6-metoxy-1,4-benzoquinol methylase